MCVALFSSSILHVLFNTVSNQEEKLSKLLNDFQLQEYESIIKDSGT